MSALYSIDVTRPLSEQALTTTEVAKRLGVHRSTVANWSTKGINGFTLPRVRIGGRFLILIGALNDFLAAIQNPEGV